MSTTVYGCNILFMVSHTKIEFEKKLLELRVSYSLKNGDLYSITSKTDYGKHLTVRLISSLTVNNQVHGCKNGIDVQAIGLFKFKLSSFGQEPDIFVFAFQNTVKSRVELIIIPTQELLRRYVKMKSQRVSLKRKEVVLWFMEDGFVYDVTNISLEGEWYFLSKGVGGRMADKTCIDYTTFLNNWGLLNMS